jgi:hypothetical protein
MSILNGTRAGACEHSASPFARRRSRQKIQKKIRVCSAVRAKSDANWSSEIPNLASFVAGLATSGAVGGTLLDGIHSRVSLQVRQDYFNWTLFMI